MCEICYCPDNCGCNPSCFCGVVIPLRLGTIFAAFQIMLCGFSFPVISLLFWPQIYILIPSSVVSVIVFSLAVLMLINMKLKNHIIFRIVLYGILFSFAIGCVAIIIGLNADFRRSSRELVESFRKLFNFKTKEIIAFQMLQSIQIVYFSFLFFSYVYCGMVFQLFEMEFAVRKRRRKSVATVEGNISRKEDFRSSVKVAIMRKSFTDVPGVHSKDPKEKKTVRIVLPDPKK